MAATGGRGKITIVIPTLDEEESIAATIEGIPRGRIREMGFSLEILVVDGESKDRTASIASSLGARVVVESRRGYGRAYRSGFGASEGDILIGLDGDGTYPSAEIPLLIARAMDEDLDFITTDRFADMERGAMGLRNRAGNMVLTAVADALFGLRLRDSQSGMWLLRRSAWERIMGKVRGDGMEFSEELKIAAFRGGLRCAEVPIRYSARAGKAKLNPWRDGLRNLLFLFRKRIRG